MFGKEVMIPTKKDIANRMHCSQGTMLEEISWKKARDWFKERRVALIPVGSTEQHGPHLPLGTDFLTAKALASAAAAESEAICTPVVPVGISEHHRQLWGTLWVAPEHFRGYTRGIATSLAHHGIKRMIFVNGHGGNSAALQEVCRKLHLEGIYALVWQWGKAVAELSTEIFGKAEVGPQHAGERETSMMLWIAEELVDKEAFEEAAAGSSPCWGVYEYGTGVSFDTIDFSQSGATGDPLLASREAGEKFFRAAVAHLIGLVRWLEELPDQKLRPTAHKQ